MNRPAIIHPRMAGAEADFYPSTVTVQMPTNTPDPESGQIVATWATRSGLGSLPAAVAPRGESNVMNTEERTAPQIIHKFMWHVSFPSYHPTIDTGDRLVVDTPALVLNILAVEHDSHAQFTRLECERVD